MKQLFILLTIFGFSHLSAQQNFSTDTLHWNKSKPLRWSDFKAKVIEGVGFSGEAMCLLNVSYEKPSVFHKTTYHIAAVFDRNQSWVNKKLKSDQGLMFFQTMFNIYEANARKLRKDLQNFTDISNPNSILQEKYSETMQRIGNEFGEMRRETKYGSDLKALLGWKVKIDRVLLEYDAYR